MNHPSRDWQMQQAVHFVNASNNMAYDKHLPSITEMILNNILTFLSILNTYISRCSFQSNEYFTIDATIYAFYVNLRTNCMSSCQIRIVEINQQRVSATSVSNFHLISIIWNEFRIKSALDSHDMAFQWHTTCNGQKSSFSKVSFSLITT